MATATQVWSFEESTHTYRENGLVLPSVTQALKSAGLICFDGIPRHVLEHKRSIGSLVHKATEMYDLGEDLSNYEIPEECWPFIEGWVNFRADCDFIPELVEHQQIGDIHRMRYGMRLDNMGPINGVPHIIEKKCGASESPVWGVQTGAYALGINRPDIGRAAVQLGPKFPRNYKVYEYRDKTDLQIWMSALALTIWKQNVGLFVAEDIPEREVL